MLTLPTWWERDAGQRGIKGRKIWDNCNSIINKIYFLKETVSFISALIFIISYLPLTLGFVILFQVSLSVKVECLFEPFHVFSDRPVIL